MHLDYLNKVIYLIISLLACSLLISISCPIMAQESQSEHSAWDLGIGITHYQIPDYNGSDNITAITTPFPYIVYTGKRLRIKGGAVHAALFSSERLFLGFSGDGTPPINSDENSSRKGMPDLDPVLEIGPSLEYYFSKSKYSYPKVFLELPLRSAIATDLTSTQHIGWLTNPRLKYHINKGKWKLRMGIGPAFANDNYYQYYYGVAPELETAKRPVYKAKSGFGGMHYTLGFGWRHKEFFWGGYLRYIDLNQVAYEDSPLIEKEYAFLSGISFAWILNSKR